MGYSRFKQKNSADPGRPATSDRPAWVAGNERTGGGALAGRRAKRKTEPVITEDRS